jgi:hypothetical protein
VVEFLKYFFFFFYDFYDIIERKFILFKGFLLISKIKNKKKYFYSIQNILLKLEKKKKN